MKKFILLIATTAFLNNAMAQSTSDILKQQAGQGVKEGASIATQQTANKVTDKVLNSIFSKKNKKAKKDNSTQAPSPATNNTNSNATTDNTTAANKQVTSTSDTSIQTYSKYDFVPGDKVLAYEDFSQDAIGDFPENWNTNSGGETVTVSGQTGHWLMLNKKGVYKQEDVNSLPDNFTYEFDLIYTGDDYAPELELFLVNAGNDKNKLDADIGQRSGAIVGIQRIPRDKGGIAHVFVYNDGNNAIDNQVQFNNNGEAKIKVSIWRQKQRMRVYVNQNKVFDLPHAFPSGKVYSAAQFKLISDPPTQDKYLIGNIKLAVGEPDTRNKLITEGKFSTTGILFDVNSANIKPESYGSLKDIADVLQDNANVHVKIIGHTDNDGDASMNLALSKKRAESVKSFLQSEFKIDASRMETDGKGAADPVAPNTTSAGKAQNRRVEFVKL